MCVTCFIRRLRSPQRTLGGRHPDAERMLNGRYSDAERTFAGRQRGGKTIASEDASLGLLWLGFQAGRATWPLTTCTRAEKRR
jgi:hypothetical protein